jgi:(1->4)-alpha-D-glucan 1-alpha-D-glucosylmutase
MTPRATYRFQFHKDFGFDQAAALVPYLEGLGVSHVYASPITTATSGSTHGYDVVDPTRINPELGGEQAFRRMATALRERGMGVIIDIVPNHMGVARGENAWWQDVLARGQASRFAQVFDIDWRRKIVLPILGEPISAVLDNGDLRIEGEPGAWTITAYGDHRLPIRPEDQAGIAGPSADPSAIRALLERQHYRLASWRTADDELNWRRFFTINELAGVRIEDPEVFELTHALYLRLYGEGLIDGVRVDHVDGLTDPAGYCRLLRERLDGIERPSGAPPGPAYIVVEKILGADESLALNWGIDGTSGYDFMEEVAALLHDPAGEVPLTELWQAISGRVGEFSAEELASRRDMLEWAFEGQLGGCVEAFARLARSAPATEGFTAGMLRRALTRLLWVFPVYRTYGTGCAAPESDAKIRERVRARVTPLLPPGEAPVAEAVLAWLGGAGPGDPELAFGAVRRFQQLSAPVAAKAVEDTAFYRYGRLLSRNDVGFDAARFAMPMAQFHERACERAKHFPHAMLTTATHDHKRGEDVRARLAVLSNIPETWRTHVLRWEELVGDAGNGVAPADRYMLYQTLFGAWPQGLVADDAAGLGDFAARVVAWQEKALREAKLRSSWQAPDEAYEGQARTLVETLLDPSASGEFLRDLTGLVEATAGAAMANSLVQVALRYTLPGMPDLYQGTECADLSLVDPDNRRPVDYDYRRALLQRGTQDVFDAAKLALIVDLLARRRAAPELFATGTYTPISVSGERAANVLAFQRDHQGQTLTVAVQLRAGPALLGSKRAVPSLAWWGNTAFDAGGRELHAADVFADSPVWITMQE